MDRTRNRQIADVVKKIGYQVVVLNRCRITEETRNAARHQPWIVNLVQIPEVVVGIDDLIDH